MNRGLLSLFAGVILVFLGILTLIRRLLQLRRCSALSTATITGADIVSRQGTVFLTLEAEIGGETLSLKRRTANKAQFAMGDRIDIRYNPDNPRDFIIEADHSQGRNGIILLILGVALFFVGVYLAGPAITRVPFGRYLMHLQWLMKYRWLRQFR